MAAGENSIPPLPRLDDQPWLAKRETQAVLAALAAGGYEGRVVGGAVRNTLIGKAVTDLDIATNAPPEETMRLAAAHGFATAPTGLAHGTVTVVVDHHPFEVTTLREDVETFGRHATVAFTADWAADARRRDFTINALYCAADGTVHDPLDGWPDLVARRVRFIGDPGQRIAEDYLRILRFFRFHAEYAHGPMDAAGLAASVAARRGLDRLSGERIRQELLKLLAAPGAVGAVRTMADYGLLTEILPVAPRLDVFARLAEVDVAAGLGPRPVLRLAGLTVAIDEDAPRVADRLRLSNDERATLTAFARGLRDDTPPSSGQEARRLLYRLGETRYIDRVLSLWAADPNSPPVAGWHTLLSLPKNWPVPKLPLSGADVLARGITPGPAVGQVLAAIELMWVDAGFPDDRDWLLRQLDLMVRKS